MSLMGNIFPAHEVGLAAALAAAGLRTAAQVQSVERDPVMRTQ